VIADRPHTIVWAFTLTLASVDLAVGRVLLLNNPCARAFESCRFVH